MGLGSGTGKQIRPSRASEVGSEGGSKNQVQSFQSAKAGLQASWAPPPPSAKAPQKEENCEGSLISPVWLWSSASISAEVIQAPSMSAPLAQNISRAPQCPQGACSTSLAPPSSCAPATLASHSCPQGLCTCCSLFRHLPLS